jgi:hypothetical protein
MVEAASRMLVVQRIAFEDKDHMKSVSPGSLSWLIIGPQDG